MSVTVHDFRKSLEWSHAQEDQPFWREVYEKAFPTMVHYQSTRQDGWAQRGGIDRTIILEDGTVVTVDEKARSECYHIKRDCLTCGSAKGTKCDGARPCLSRTDILIEHWSDGKREIPGWGHRDKALTCDYIAYAIIPNQTCYLLPYQLLRRAIKLNGRTWWNKANQKEVGYRRVEADNGRYKTISYVVPTDVLLDAIRDCLVVNWEGETQ